MFCDSRNDPDEKRPNTNVCPVCMGHPGTLPTINKEAVRHILKLGLAVGGALAERSAFDRKNYFYPDLPKGYQISQYPHPLVQGGTLRNVALTRIHLEEDTARSLHGEGEYSLVDYNRAGIPLMELVTEPVIRSAEEAGAFARELQLLLRSLGAGAANLEKGEMRVEANVSVSLGYTLGTKVEVKNLNSFRSVVRAIDYEVQRQSGVLARGGRVIQETRGWDEVQQQTHPQRLKEESHDYRYFPEPDLPPLRISDIRGFNLENLQRELPELPWEIRARYSSYGLKSEDAETLLQNNELRTLFEFSIALYAREPAHAKVAANYLTSDLVGLMRTEVPGSISNITPESFGELMEMVRMRELASRGAKNILAELYRHGGNPRETASALNLIKIEHEDTLLAVLSEIEKEYPKAVSDYREGRVGADKFIIGKAMQKTGGAADPVQLHMMLPKVFGLAK